jgi:hypothetical protein
MARFEWFLDTVEKEKYLLRPRYPEPKSLTSGLRMGWRALSAWAEYPGSGPVSPSAVSQGRGKA